MSKKHIENGLTNKLWLQNDRTIIKFYSDSSWPVHIMSFLHIGFFEPPLYTINRRKNEADARNDLASLNIPVPKIHQSQENWIQQAFIDGKPLNELLKSNKTHKCYKAGIRVGSILEKIHLNGKALLDARASNFIVTPDTVWSIDHEFYRHTATQLQQELDTVTLLSTVLVGNKKSVEAFLNGLNARYPELFSKRKGIAYSLGLCSLIAYTAIQHRSLTAFMKGLRNWFLEVLPRVRGKT